MSEEFHVHAAHEHEIEHQAHKGVGLAQSVAIFTAILSTFAAVASYNSASEQTEALMLKNEAIIKQAQASDQWAFYQSKSNKGHLMELASELVPANKAQYYNQQIQRYNQQKDQIKNSAQALEASSFQADSKSDALMSKHHQQSQGMMLLQIAISMASITALTRKKWLFTFASLAAVGGIIFSVFSWF
jgi:hypothetical protein